MTPFTSLRRGSGRSGNSGQMVVVFALCLIAIIAMTGLLIDGGRAWAERRQAQAAADTAALAGAVSLDATGAISPPLTDPAREAAAAAAAKAIAVSNGFGTTGAVDCNGVALLNDGIKVNWPPSDASAFWNDPLYIEVFTTRAMRTAFAGVVGQPCWLVTTRATAKIPGPHANCGICAITKYKGDGDDNVLDINNTGHMRADAPIFVNGPHLVIPPNCVPLAEFQVCGTAIHLYHNGGTPGDVTFLSAPSIATSGGWRSEALTRARGDTLYTPCVQHPDPNGYAMHGYPTSNVCIGATPLDDPFNPKITPPDAFATPIPHKGVGSCPNTSNVLVPTGTVGSPAKLNVTQAPIPGAVGPNYIICPGLYPGGFSLFSGFGVPVHIDMVPGVYLMLGGGFLVSGSASITGDGVMIYNTSGINSYSAPTAPWTGTLPPATCTGACPTPGAAVTGLNFADIEDTNPYVMTLTGAGGVTPGGTVTFYDGDDVLAGCENMALVPIASPKATATCPVTFHGFGTHWVTAVYSGDTVYKPTSANKKVIVNPNAILGQKEVDICTGDACGASADCDVNGSCKVLLSAPPKGAAYQGMLIFQDRRVQLGIRIWPKVGLPACTGSWMTDHTPDGNMAAPAPDPCGPMGGLRGTIYSPHSRSDPPCPDGSFACGKDSILNFRADGASFLQLVAGRINLEYNTDVRFLFDPDEFVGGGGIQLVE